VTGATDTLATLIDAFANGRLDAATACFADDAVYREARGSTLHGRPAIAEHFRHFAALGQAWRFTVDDVIHEGERACVVYRFATAGGAGERWRERAGCATVRLGKGGLIAEWREYEG
jgi:ketosteroid isomerase-like protein